MNPDEPPREPQSEPDEWQALSWPSFVAGALWGSVAVIYAPWGLRALGAWLDVLCGSKHFGGM